MGRALYALVLMHAWALGTVLSVLYMSKPLKTMVVLLN